MPPENIMVNTNNSVNPFRPLKSSLDKNLHLLNTMWAVILPGCVSAYNVVVARTFFKQSIPKELLKSSLDSGYAASSVITRLITTPIKV